MSVCLGGCGDEVKYLAICTNVPELCLGGWRDRDACKKYPGASWLPEIDILAMSYGVVPLSGSEALARVDRGEISAKDVYIVQEETNRFGSYLLAAGAHNLLLLCFESPLYTPRFYDMLPEYKKYFPYQMLFQGGTHHLKFPIFDNKDVVEPKPWSDRKFMCTVSSNKHYKAMPDIDSHSYQEALKTQLHDARYQAMEYFKSQNCLDLYGRGWPAGVGQEIAPNDKISTISGYKFYLCYENGSQPGYVTEKIIDCFVAGVIPVYLGAPDIWQHVDRRAVVEASYSNGDYDNLFNRLKSICLDQKYMDTMLRRARKFLASEAGQKHSNRGFAQDILNLFHEHTRNPEKVPA